MTGTGFQDAAAILDELAEGDALAMLIAEGTPAASGIQENMRNLRGTLLRTPPVITPD